ncbi:MAG: peptide/nickel transport system permease protein [Thermomicrobiales bacterium]|jgi:peptide/nickel transport system permease protein|nr:peptide/nickel transport system permease protein [Thermomicrobiales bacterium]MEA2531892.1 peptide/nickel transport system permease protein [Thermomicrobiales bacterium]MEA2582484.1 peptide/nickel transport system permease protein [Thermomicrobiales bacterium]MEA2598809.1 peptide/nickel transport system permease protein [Thermomicrobiales bacterium]
MGNYLLRRLVQVVPTIVGISILVFGLMRFLPGDIVSLMVNPDNPMPEDQRETLRRMFGLNEPIYVQYLRWVGGIARGDFGVSLRMSTPVTSLLFQRLGVTVELALLAVAFSALIAVPLGVLAAVRPNGISALSAQVLGLVGLSFPSFWIATMLLLVSSLYFDWQPELIWISPFDDPIANAQQMFLPVLSLSLALIAVVMRMTRSAMLDTLSQDYIRTARAKGHRERIVIWRHAFKNALIPVMTVIGLQIGGLLGGAVVIEQIFGLPGIGWLILNAIYQRDYPVVQGGVLFVAVGFVLINLLVDLLYSYVNPRIRYS